MVPVERDTSLTKACTLQVGRTRTARNDAFGTTGVGTTGDRRGDEPHGACMTATPLSMCGPDAGPLGWLGFAPAPPDAAAPTTDPRRTDPVHHRLVLTCLEIGRAHV